VRVLLPLTDAAAVDTADDLTAGSGAPRATVLLVEDEEPVRRAMARMLERAGFRVHQATSGLDAIARFLDTCVPDVLVTDVIMPGGLSGQDVADRFRTRHPDLAVVFVSGYAPDLLTRRGLQPTSVRMLAKPFTERDLCAATDGALRARTAVD
jgi:CheY-like chemotaxis protein